MSAQTQSLQHTEAQARFALLSVTSYDVSLDLTSSEETFGSVTTIVFESQGGPTFLDLKPVALTSVRLNDRALEPGALDRGRFPLETAAGTNVLVVDAVMPFRNDGEGLHRSVDPADGRHYVYGMSFLDAAPTIFACFDQPDLKAPYTMHVRAPHDWLVVGNAPALNPEPGVWEIGPTLPLSTYFVTIVAGPYHLIRDEHDGIALGLSCRQSLAPHLEADADELLTMTRQCFDEYHRLFGIRYPFGDYHQAFVPEFNAGAMENPGCVTLRDQYVFDSRVTRGQRIFRATTLAHEMAHQWFGNITTPKWWDDLWLNESFAEYMGNRVTSEVTQYHDAWTSVAWSRRQWGLNADQRPSTHPVAGNGAVDAVAALQDFDGISYAKGSNILKQLAATMGDDVFFAGARDHFDRHRFGNATMYDLVESWERSGAADLSRVVSQWLRLAGPDTFTLERTLERTPGQAPGQQVLRRTAPPDHPAERPHTFDLARVTGPTLEPRVMREHVVVTAETTLVTAADDDAVVVDPDHASWGVYVPDAVTIAGLVDRLPHVTDDAVVAAVWNNVKSGFSVAAIDPDRVVDLLVAAFPAVDTEDTPRHTMPWVLGQVLPAASSGSIARVHDAAVATMDAAETGSERQLSAFRAAVHTATDPARLRVWLDGPPRGIDADLDIRWRLLKRLAALGATDEAELDAALADEPTAHTRVDHTEAVASLPTPEAKTFAWQRFTGEVDVPNYELEAAGLGLWTGGPSDLTAPYVARYFDELPRTAAVRSGWNLALSADAFFPACFADDDTLARAQALLATDTLPLAVRRRVVDQVDALERRLAVLRAFPHASHR